MNAATVAPLLLGLAGALAAAGWAWAGPPGRRRAACCALVVALVAAAGLDAATAARTAVYDDTAAVLVVVLAGLTAVAGGGLLAPQVFALVDRASHRSAVSVTSAATVLRGGAWIGALERVAVFAALVAGWPTGLAVVLALKGLGRYPELRNQEHTATAERFIIGTFLSVLWAVACAGIAVALTR